MFIQEAGKKSILKSIALSFAGAWIMAIMIWAGAGAFPGGRYTYMAGDLLVQYVDIIHMFLRHIFHGESLIYSFEYGMGMPTWATYAYYVFSPFNLIFAVVSDLDLAAFLVITAKLATAAAAFSLLVERVFRPRCSFCISFSVAYAFCGYVMHFYLGIIFMDALYWMPLLVLAIRHFVKSGKWQALCVVYAYTFIVQFYAAYMSGIFSFMIYISYMVYCFGKDYSRWKKSILRYFLCLGCAVMISAIVTLPAAVELFRLMATDTTEFGKNGAALTAVMGALYPFKQTDQEGLYNSWPELYTGLMAVIMCVCLFADRNVSGKKKVFFAIPLVFQVLCIIWMPAYMIIHGFDAPDGYDYRFTAQTSLWILFSAMAWMDCEKTEIDESGVKKKVRLWRMGCFGAIFIYAILYVIQSFWGEKQEQYLSITAGVVIVFFLMLYAGIGYGRTKLQERLLAIVFLTEIAMNGWSVQQQANDDCTRDRVYYDLWQQQAESALQMIKDAERDNGSSFYRIRYLNGPTNNISMLYGYHGLGYFSSIEYENERNCLNRLGYATSSRIVKDYGSTALTRMLFAQKYSVECGYFEGEQREKYMVYKNDYILPLAYMVSGNIEGYHLESTDAFANLNGLASAMLGKECTVYDESINEIRVEPRDMEILLGENSILVRSIDKEKPNGETEISIQSRTEEQLYAYLSRFGEADNDLRSPFVASSIDIGGFLEPPFLTMPHIIPVDVDENGTGKIKIMMNWKGYSELSFESIHFAYEDKNTLSQLYEWLSEDSMRVIQADDGLVRGKVNNNNGKSVLFTSIPYDQYWQAYIDGEQVKTIALVDGAFLALNIPAGEHEICLVYRNHWIILGGIISLTGIILILFMQREKSVDGRKKDFK